MSISEVCRHYGVDCRYAVHVYLTVQEKLAECLSKTISYLRKSDFLPEEILDILHAANAEKVCDNIENCWPARGGVFVRFDEKTKPQFVGSIKEFRTLMSHMVAQKNTQHHTFKQRTPQPSAGQVQTNDTTQTSPTDTEQKPGNGPKTHPASTTQGTPPKAHTHTEELIYHHIHPLM